MDRIDEIRERLRKATPGPWFKTANWYVSSDKDYSIYSRAGTWRGDNDPLIAQVQGPGAQRGDDFELITHAPADLAYLLSHLDAARKVVEAARKALRSLNAYNAVSKTTIAGAGIDAFELQKACAALSRAQDGGEENTHG